MSNLTGQESLGHGWYNVFYIWNAMECSSKDRLCRCDHAEIMLWSRCAFSKLLAANSSFPCRNALPPAASSWTTDLALTARLRWSTFEQADTHRRVINRWTPFVDFAWTLFVAGVFWIKTVHISLASTVEEWRTESEFTVKVPVLHSCFAGPGVCR